MKWFINYQKQVQIGPWLIETILFYFSVSFAPPPPIFNDTQAESNLRSILRLRDIASKMPSKLQKIISKCQTFSCMYTGKKGNVLM